MCLFSKKKVESVLGLVSDDALRRMLSHIQTCLDSTFFQKQVHGGTQSTVGYNLLSATSRFLAPLPPYGLFALVSKLWKILIFTLSSYYLSQKSTLKISAC